MKRLLLAVLSLSVMTIPVRAENPFIAPPSVLTSVCTNPNLDASSDEYNYCWSIVYPQVCAYRTTHGNFTSPTFPRYMSNWNSFCDAVYYGIIPIPNGIVPVPPSK